MSEHRVIAVRGGQPPSGRTAGGDALTELLLATFALNGRFLAAADELSRPAGLTGARWQVLGAVLHEPRSVAGIARVMGLARQSVQPIANLLVGQGLAEYRDNPAHRRAKLLVATEAGLEAVRSIRARQTAWADAIAAHFEPGELEQALATSERLLVVLDEHPPQSLTET